MDESTPKGYALFDLDQTLVPWDTQLLFCNFVIKKMPIRRLFLLILIPFLPLTKALGAEGMKRVFLNYLWRLSKDELDELAEEFVEEIFPHQFYHEIVAIFNEQKKLGRLVVLSSASPEIWVAPIAKKLGADHYFGTEVEVDGRVRLFPDIIGGNNKGANKLVKMKQILPQGFNPGAGDILPNSHGFSDSHADLPMLRICESATMVHPTEKLLAEGEKKDWQLLTPDRPTTGKPSFAKSCILQSLGLYKAK